MSTHKMKTRSKTAGGKDTITPDETLNRFYKQLESYLYAHDKDLPWKTMFRLHLDDAFETYLKNNPHPDPVVKLAYSEAINNRRLLSISNNTTSKILSECY